MEETTADPVLYLAEISYMFAGEYSEMHNETA